MKKFSFKSVVENEKIAFNAKNDIEKSKDEMREEFYETLKQYNLKVLKLEHLNKVEPLSDEIPVLKIEIEAMFLRVSNLHKEMRDKYKELEYRFEVAKNKSIILKKLGLI